MRTDFDLKEKLDLIIRNGHIVDGAGNPWFRADVGVRDGRIVKVANLALQRAEKVIDAKGLTVCPGFIDIHNHSDTTLLVNPKAESMVRQGVTTQVIGNCGYSCAPVREETKDVLEAYIREHSFQVEKIEWQSFNEYLVHLSRKQVATNVVPLVGHGAVRIAVLGFANRLATEKELEKMKEIVAQAMEEGAFGISAGLAYSPGMFSDSQEIVELCKVAAKYGGIFTIHIRAEANWQVWEKSLKEAIDIAEKAGIRLQISHIESHYPNWGDEDKALRILEEARERGLDVTTDIPPYVSGCTPLNSLFPPWAQDGGIRNMVKRLGNFEFREKIRDFVMNQREKHSMPTISMVADGLSDKLWIVTSQKNPELIGKSLKEISELRDTDPLAAAMDLMIEEGGESMHIVAEFHFEDDMRKVIRHPLSMIMSDEYSWAPYGPLGKEARVHPRCYGTFPLTIRKYVRGETRKEEPREVGEKIITLMEAIRKMTSFPAQKLGLWDRGLIREGMCADIVVFDSQIIEDQATYANPHQYPKGLPYVIVNGRLVVENGEHTSELPGKILRGPGYLARS